MAWREDVPGKPGGKVSAEEERRRMVDRQTVETQRMLGVRPPLGASGATGKPAPRMVSAEEARQWMIKRGR